MTIPLWKQFRPEVLKPYLEQKDREKEAKLTVQSKDEENSFQIPFKGVK